MQSRVCRGQSQTPVAQTPDRRRARGPRADEMVSSRFASRLFIRTRDFTITHHSCRPRRHMHALSLNVQVRTQYKSSSISITTHTFKSRALRSRLRPSPPSLHYIVLHLPLRFHHRAPLDSECTQALEIESVPIPIPSDPDPGLTAAVPAERTVGSRQPR